MLPLPVCASVITGKAAFANTKTAGEGFRYRIIGRALVVPDAVGLLMAYA